MLDPQRFTRGVEPDAGGSAPGDGPPAEDDIRNEDGSPRFRAGATRAIEVTYTERERSAQPAAAIRRRCARRAGPGRWRGRNDLVTLLLKKRLFSAPAAFALTLHGYLDSRGGSPGLQADTRHERYPGGCSCPAGWTRPLDWDTDPADDEAGSDAERAASDRLADAAASCVPDGGGVAPPACATGRSATASRRTARPGR